MLQYRIKEIIRCLGAAGLVWIVLLGCEEDSPKQKMKLIADGIENLAISDVGNSGNGQDMQVSFQKAVDEDKIGEYRIIVVKAGSALPTLPEAETLVPQLYTVVPKSGSDVSVTLGATATDLDSDLIVEEVAYRVLVLSVADGDVADTNTLSGPSNQLSLISKTNPVANVTALDYSNNGNGKDIQVSFQKAPDESLVSTYRAIIVKSVISPGFTLVQADGLLSDRYVTIAKTGANIVRVLTPAVKDSDGDLIDNDITYRVFVLSVADGIITDKNALSEASAEFTLTAFEVTITKRGNIGINLQPGQGVFDIWGYTDSLGRHFAIVGRATSQGVTGTLSFFDVSNPALPVLAKEISGVAAFDVKVWQNYAYTVNGGGNGTANVIDIRDPYNPVVVNTMSSSHNITISDSGYMYLSFPGVRIYDLNPDPTNPELKWSGGTEGHDVSVIGDMMFDNHGYTGTFIRRLNNPFTPFILGTITDPTITYHHQSWPSADGKYLFITDELSQHPNADISVWDIQNPGNPIRVGAYNDPSSTVHNIFVFGNLAYTSYYSAGFRVFDVSNPRDPVLAAEYDTNSTTGEAQPTGFAGAFGIFPFAPTGYVYIADSEGLFIFEVTVN